MFFDGEATQPAESEQGISSDTQPTPENPGEGHEEPTVLTETAPEANGAAGVGGIIATEPVAAEEFHQAPEETPAPFVDVPNLDIIPGDDSGDSQPVRFADSSAGIDIVVDGVQKFRHVFMPNSTPLHDTLDAALKHSDGGIDLTALAVGGGYTVRLNGETIDPKTSSLDLGVRDGAVIEVELK